MSARCHSFDGQCGDSWCNCDGYELAADKCKGKILGIMRIMKCSRAIAIRVSRWWFEQHGQAKKP